MKDNASKFNQTCQLVRAYLVANQGATSADVSAAIGGAGECLAHMLKRDLVRFEQPIKGKVPARWFAESARSLNPQPRERFEG